MSYTVGMECRGEVVKKEGKRAVVRVARVNCAECGGCGLLARDREQVVEFTVADRFGVKIGDEVRVRVPSGRLYLAYLTVFALPILAMAAFYLAMSALLMLAGVESVQGISVAVALAAGFAFFWVGIKLAERMGLSPVMTGLAGGEAGEAPQSREPREGETG